MKKLLLASLMALSLNTNADYCTGKWTDDADAYCATYMTYVRSVVMDFNVGRPKSDVYSEIHNAVHDFHIPYDLAGNVIDFIYQHKEKQNPDMIAWGLMGGCIDNFVTLQAQGIEEANLLGKPTYVPTSHSKE